MSGGRKLSVSSMSKYEISFESSDYGRLDEFALLACQDYNLGNQGEWFGSFRGGLYGFHSRLHGLATHYNTVHAWIPVPRVPSETEHLLASIFFCMDSAIECLTFSVNALGYAIRPKLFRDVDSSSKCNSCIIEHFKRCFGKSIHVASPKAPIRI